MIREEVIHEVDFPFIVLHDPMDEVCLVEGTELLMKASSTASHRKVCRLSYTLLI